MLKIALRVLPLILGICGTLAQGYIPSALVRCSVDDKNCFKTQAEQYVKYYKNGIPEHGIPGVEPLELGALNFRLGNSNSPLQMELEATNVAVANFGNGLIVDSLQINASATDLTTPFNVIWKISFPELDINADYTLKGKFLILPMNSKGKLKAKLTKVVVTATCFNQPEKRKDGNTYLKIVKIGATESIGSIKINFTNLFKDAELNEATVKVFNDEFSTFEGEIKPKLMNAITRKMKSVLQKLFDVMPYEGLFLNKKVK
ncbi:circadian clock-controlled protein daywake-like [Drosophila albomicans]|uniref:Circadian clock-controlled protein daywake-like n=1 Tax=Drosophila albomicans TaxID=7291 RepID=A0A6P8WQF3_DROAB|nr:circadian clock-controlled protein daywake-like [Drosophila albomicans]